MKAIVYTKYGSPDVLQLKEVEKPTPKEEEVLVKVHAASLNAADLEYLRGVFVVRLLYQGLLKPKNANCKCQVLFQVWTARGNWTYCAQLVQTMSLITLKKISPKMGSIMT